MHDLPISDSTYENSDHEFQYTLQWEALLAILSTLTGIQHHRGNDGLPEMRLPWIYECEGNWRVPRSLVRAFGEQWVWSQCCPWKRRLHTC